MAKKKQNKKEKANTEQRVNLRLTGIESTNFLMCGTGGTDVFRCGLYDEQRKVKPTKEIELKSKILHVQNKIIEHKLEVKANELLLNDLFNELKQVKGFTETKRKKLIKSMKKEYFDFIDDERYAECDLSDFYYIKKDKISIYAMRCGIDYEYAVEVFDNYLEDEVAKQNILENERLSENQ